MDDPRTALSLIVAAVLGGVSMWWSGRNLRRSGVGTSQAEAIANLQIVADTWEERYNLESQARMSVERELAEARAKQALERELAAQCRGDLDDARSRIRVLERRRQPRADA